LYWRFNSVRTLLPIDGVGSAPAKRDDQAGTSDGIKGERIGGCGIDGHGNPSSGQSAGEHAPASAPLTSGLADSVHALTLPSARRLLFEFEQFLEQLDVVAFDRYLDSLSYEELDQLCHKALLLRSYPPGLDRDGVYLGSEGYQYSREVSP
jgi:hypothetical protein